jgi:hypothetical protein
MTHGESLRVVVDQAVAVQPPSSSRRGERFGHKALAVAMGWVERGVLTEEQMEATLDVV